MFGALGPNLWSNLVRRLTFRTPNFYIAPYGKIKHGLVNVTVITQNNIVNQVITVTCNRA